MLRESYQDPYSTANPKTEHYSNLDSIQHNGKKFPSGTVTALDAALTLINSNPDTGIIHKVKTSFYLSTDSTPKLCIRHRGRTLVDSHHCIGKSFIRNAREIAAVDGDIYKFYEIVQPYIPFQTLVPILLKNWNHPINCIRIEQSSHDRIHTVPEELRKEYSSMEISELVANGYFFWNHEYDALMLACNTILLYENYYYPNHGKFPNALHRNYVNDIFEVHREIRTYHRKIYSDARILLYRNQLLKLKES